MPRYGDITLDVPCITSGGVNQPDEMMVDAHTALEFVQKFIEDKGFDFRARIVMNPHDFGSYPSIEVDASWIDDSCGCGEVGCMVCDRAAELKTARDRDLCALDEDYGEHFKDSL
jgi:hypothetical protein